MSNATLNRPSTLTTRTKTMSKYRRSTNASLQDKYVSLIFRQFP